jgi:hypothetical protein
MCATLIKIADQAALVAGSESIQEIVGFRSTASLASVMLAVLAFDLTIVVVLIAMRSQESQQRVFLAQTRLPPELTLAVGSEWHAFLSHLWATGQGTLEQATRPPLRTCAHACGVVRLRPHWQPPTAATSPTCVPRQIKPPSSSGSCRRSYPASTPSLTVTKRHAPGHRTSPPTITSQPAHSRAQHRAPEVE